MSFFEVMGVLALPKMVITRWTFLWLIIRLCDWTTSARASMNGQIPVELLDFQK
jgi:hypothetical protein